MADLIPIVAKMRAFEARRAVRIAARRNVAMQPHALTICTLAMAGEDTTVHAVAIGHAGDPAQIRVVPDPRVRNDHYALFEWMLGHVEPYFLQCRSQGDFPQVWVSSAVGAAHLDTLADRLRYNRDNAPARRLGELLSYATERFPIDGQQALISATAALRRHFATGQPPGEDEHLLTLLTWIRPPANRDVHTALSIAEAQPMGVNTNPEFDHARLAKRLGAYNDARKRNATRAELAARGDSITRELTPIVENIYDAVQRARTELEALGPDETADLLKLREFEASQFERFMQRRDQNLPLPYRDKPRAAAFRIAERERMIQATEAGQIHSEHVARARAYLKGDVVRATVEKTRRVRVGDRKVERLVVRTVQRALRIRAHDIVASLADPRLRFEVFQVSRRGRWTLISLDVKSGMVAVGCPGRGAALELGPEGPDWDAYRRERKQMVARLSDTPWTHATNLPPSDPRTSARPADLVADIEALK